MVVTNVRFVVYVFLVKRCFPSLHFSIHTFCMHVSFTFLFSPAEMKLIRDSKSHEISLFSSLGET